jgi:uncharacterized protein involved in exopolysaccharide biosynthesis
LNLITSLEPVESPEKSSSSLAPDLLQVDSAAAQLTSSGLRVSLKLNTRVVVIEYTRTSPQRWPMPSTLWNTYVEQNFKTKFESTMQASDWLTKQPVDPQMKGKHPKRSSSNKKEHRKSSGR